MSAPGREPAAERKIPPSLARALVELRAALARGQRRLVRRRAAVEADLARLADVPALERAGQLLVTYGKSVPRGATVAHLQDWETGEPVPIALDPARRAEAQAPALFAKARRLRKGEPVMRARLDATRAHLLELDAILAELERATDTEDAERAVARARALAPRVGIRISDPTAHPAAEPSPEKGRVPQRRPYHRFFSSDGRPILVGRGADDNDALTLHHAKAWHLFLHARGVTGAHVIVPKGRDEACPPDLLLDAATLAVHFSEARREGAPDVTYAERRYVRKPKKSPPGAVLVDRPRVLQLRPDPDRLARLLATKEC